jgi:hypothetical protein
MSVFALFVLWHQGMLVTAMLPAISITGRFILRRFRGLLYHVHMFACM